MTGLEPLSILKSKWYWYESMKSQQTILTALGCAGSLAAMLAVAGPAVASPVEATTASSIDEGLTTLMQSESNPIMDTLRCGCARCTIGDIQPAL